MLIRDFTRGKRHHQDLSTLIFQKDPGQTRALLFSNYSQLHLWRNIPFLCTLKENISKEVTPNPEFTLLWTHPKIDQIENAQNYTWLITVWLRINVSHSINESSNLFFSKNPYTIKKLDMFCNNHLKVVQYLDSFEDPTDEAIDHNILLSLISPLGNTPFSEDLTDWVPSNVESIQIRETPLETLQKQFPLLEFNPLKISLYEYFTTSNLHYDPLRHKALKDSDNYQKYIGCVLVLESLFQLKKQHPSNDAIHYYYVGFVDLFYYCINCEWSDMSDTILDQHMKENIGVSIWEANNPLVDTRAFHAGDLPDLFRTLTDIPLNGEQHKADFMAAKIIQKSLPFCGQRRKLIDVASGFTESSTAFWKLYARVFWCVLAGMYPGDLHRPDMEKLLAIRQITDETCARNSLNKILKIGEYNGSALIVFTAFRRYIVYMAEFNAHYLEEAKRCIDWVTFESDTITRANLMRSCVLSDPSDMFASMRKLMMDMHKNESELIVYRYKKYSLIKTIVQHCNNTLEKTIYKSLQDWLQDRHTLQTMRSMFEEGLSESEIRKYSNQKSPIIWDIFSNKFIPLEECFERCAQKIAWFVSSLENDVSVECKENLLNILIKVPKDDRLKLRAVRLMELPKYGGISSVASKTLIALTEVYKENPVPRKFNELIRKLNVYDFKVVSWYLNIVNMLDKINFTVWDATTVKRLDFAMTHKRHVLFPGQTIPKGSYHVYMTLCCSRIATFKGSAYFGHKSISYDINMGSFVCCKRHGKKINFEGDDDVDVEVVDEVIEMGNVDTKRYIRNKRKNFMQIPCKGQAVMKISLRGFHMIYGNERDHLKRYCHCPNCGSFHEFKWLNFAGSKDAEYRCGECKAKELNTDVIYECCYCLARPSKPITHFEALKRSVYVMYSHDEHEPFKLKYFCKKHHKYAKIKSNQLSKDHLWAYIQKKERQKRLRIAMGIFR